ncbi:D-aminoacylase [Actinopolymorpha sp. B9G3]|uniref:N-acyl-D-amino-acid deacylase family protein n=1 Tax=Actinopolymorpha sp. B9G3 TaxID=3158970 RepID=UPI0032D965C1
MAHDILLRGGTLIDGTGAPGRTADVLVADGRVVDVSAVGAGGLDVNASEVVDIPGAVVCPGFIDLHSHADFTVFGAPEAVTQVTQGVTTLVTGNCGFSPFPVVPHHADELRAHGRFIDDGLTWEWSSAGEYADAVGRLPLGVNLALQVGHGALRIAAMGGADRAPTPAELERMRALVARSANAVVGFSTGLIYAPGTYAEADELVAIATQTAAEGLLYSTHMRDEGGGLLDAVNEALTISRRSGVRLEISHLKASGPAFWGSVAEALDLIEAARAEGVDVGADQYPYTASSTTLTSWLPGWALDGGPAAMLKRLDDPDQAERIARDLGGDVGGSFDPERIVVADTPDGPYQRFVGRTIEAAAVELGLDTAHAAVELLRGQRGLLGVVNHSMSEDDVRRILRDPAVAVASDGHVLGCPGRGRPHPRGLGTFTRVLGHYVRDERVLDLPLAVRTMTELPASRLGWSDRGVVRPGAVADLAVFDSGTVTDRASFEDPWQLSTGVLHTLVGGTMVLRDGVPTSTPAGQVIHRRPRP